MIEDLKRLGFIWFMIYLICDLYDGCSLCVLINMIYEACDIYIYIYNPNEL